MTSFHDLIQRLPLHTDFGLQSLLSLDQLIVPKVSPTEKQSCAKIPPSWDCRLAIVTLCNWVWDDGYRQVIWKVTYGGLNVMLCTRSGYDHEYQPFTRYLFDKDAYKRLVIAIKRHAAESFCFDDAELQETRLDSDINFTLSGDVGRDAPKLIQRGVE